MAFLIAAAVIILFVFLISLICYLICFYQSDKKKKETMALPSGEQYKKADKIMKGLMDELTALPYEEVFITSFDGLRLFGKYYHVKDGAPLQIMFHGYRGSAERDFCGGSKLARERDYNALIIDERAHGKSGGHTICFGVKERYDVLSWVNYAVERFGKDTEILLYGVSMGSATVLMASGLDLPENVKGIIADCPFSSPKDIIMKVTRELHLPPKLMFPFIYLGGLIFGRVKISSCTAADEVRKAKIPMLIFHGEDDRFVPHEMSGEIYKANPELVTRLTFPGAGHGLSFIEDFPRYKKAVEDFWDKALK